MALTPRRLAILAGVVLVAIVANGLSLHFDDPMGAVHAEARRMGHELEDLQTLEAGHGSRFLERTAHGEFLVEADGVAQRVTIEVARATPFHSWRLVTYRKEPATQ